MRIETSRLIIRSFQESDIEAYAAIVGDPVVTRFLGDGLPHTFAQARSYVLDCIHREHDTGISRYAVTRNKEGNFIGFSGFKQLDGYIDFGWRFVKSVWGSGYGTEAALAVLTYGIQELKLHGIRAGSTVANRASVRIIEKLGFVLDGYRKLNGRRTVVYVQPGNV